MKDKRKIGFNSEDKVALFLMRRGFTLIAKNYSVHNVGELDLVMRKGDCLYVVEVKSRLESDWQSPSEAIDYGKRKRILKTTQIFIQSKGYFDKDVIFLAGCVTHNLEGIVQKIEIIPFE